LRLRICIIFNYNGKFAFCSEESCHSSWKIKGQKELLFPSVLGELYVRHCVYYIYRYKITDRWYVSVIIYTYISSLMECFDVFKVVFLVVLVFEFGDLHLLGRCSVAWVICVCKHLMEIYKLPKVMWLICIRHSEHAILSLKPVVFKCQLPSFHICISDYN
jgi:hypothetical protein